ncbi:unnamed protein product [Cylindrotheca closterium]|uniref:Uncharacterized protein n=1 Tax=Cylindrotheca closterium TaxID=2856 RepID=A0AAD2CVJ5_9STRA|nr:unnamed protein product [Cylindrotheca closterium]
MLVVTRIVWEACLLLTLIGSESWWHSTSNLAHAFAPSIMQPHRTSRAGGIILHSSTKNEEVMTAESSTFNPENLEPTLELLQGWTEEYFQAVDAAGGITEVAGFEHFYSEDYVQSGPTIGPVNKRDYLNALAYYGREGLNLGAAIPDLTADFDGWHLDPHYPWRVWVVARYRGTHVNAAKLPGSGAELKPQDPPKAFYNGPEMYSFLWTPSKQIQWMSVGYVGDKFTGDNLGYGALVGLLIPMGVPKAAIDLLAPLLSLQVWLSQFNDGVEKPRTLTPYSQLPPWWKQRKKYGLNIKQ